MEKKKSSDLFWIKTGFIFFSCISALIIISCAQNDSDFSIADPELTEIGSAEKETIEKGDKVEVINDLSPLSETPEIPINLEEKEIYYDGEEYADLLASHPICISNGENIYLASQQKMYSMQIGTAEIHPIDIDIPDGLEIYNFAFDGYGRMHMLLVDCLKNEYYIYRLDENYQINKIIDISKYTEEKPMPIWFLIQKDGYYFIQWSLNRNGIIVDSDGVLKHRFTLESLGTQWTRQAALGKDGQIYLIYENQDGEWEIGKINMKNCTIENENTELCFSNSELFTAASSGTDTKLLLLSPYSGVWAYDMESGIMENRATRSDIDAGFESGSEFWLSIFLPDGRICLLGEADSNNRMGVAYDKSSVHLLFKYIPMGK